VKGPTAAKRQKNQLAAQIGKALRGARNRFGLTQEDVAERVGLAAEVYGRMERGTVLPSVPTLVRLANALGVSANFLVGLATEESPDDADPSQAIIRDGLTSDSRRVLRIVRRMEPEELRTFKKLAGGLLKHMGKSGKVASNGR
jgi:transcriptional regulator with XRE-family HTH domain